MSSGKQPSPYSDNADAFLREMQRVPADPALSPERLDQWLEDRSCEPDEEQQPETD